MHLSLRVAVVAAALIPSLTLHALADQRYGVAGEDTYRIGRVLNETHITYHGIEHLGIATDSQGKRYVADVAYTRVDDTGKASVHGKFEQELLHDGSFEDRRDEDPDFLTILNQPFAVQLDLTTLRDLERMQGTVPFAAASPLGGSRLVGSLRAAPPGKIDGRMVVGVRFKADGPMTGTLPPCEFMKMSLRHPARATLSPISVHARVTVSSENVSVPGYSMCSLDLPTAWTGRINTGISSGICLTAVAR